MTGLLTKKWSPWTPICCFKGCEPDRLVVADHHQILEKCFVPQFLRVSCLLKQQLWVQELPSWQNFEAMRFTVVKSFSSKMWYDKWDTLYLYIPGDPGNYAHFIFYLCSVPVTCSGIFLRTKLRPISCSKNAIQKKLNFVRPSHSSGFVVKSWRLLINAFGGEVLHPCRPQGLKFSPPPLFVRRLSSRVRTRRP